MIQFKLLNGWKNIYILLTLAGWETWCLEENVGDNEIIGSVRDVVNRTHDLADWIRPHDDKLNIA